MISKIRSDTLLTLWEGSGPLTWSQRTSGPPHSGKCGREASSEPVEKKGGRKILVATKTHILRVACFFKAKKRSVVWFD